MSDPYAHIARPVLSGGVGASVDPGRQRDPYAAVATPRTTSVAGQAGRGAYEGGMGVWDQIGSMILPGQQGLSLLENVANSTDTISDLMRAAMGKGNTVRPMQGPAQSAPFSDQMQGIGERVQQQHPGFVTPREALSDKPQSKPQEYARTIAQFLSGTLAGGGVEGGVMPTAGRLGTAAVSGGASQLGGDVAGDLAGKINPAWAAPAKATGRIVGGIVPGVIGGAMFGGPRIEEETIANRTPEMSPQQQARIVARMQNGEDIGFPNTLPEAIDTETGGASRMAGIQRDLEGRKAGINAIGPMMAERPARAGQVMARVLDEIGPERDPVSVSQSAQDTAKGVIKTAEQARTAETGPLYRAAEGQPVDPQRVAALLSEMDAQIAQDPTGLLTSGVREMRELLAETPPTAGNFSTIAQHFNERAELPPGTEGAMQRRPAGILGGFVGQLEDMLGPEHAAANQRFADISRQSVDPLTGGPVGRVAKPYSSSESNLATQTGALYPDKPFPGQAQLTADAIRQLGPSGADLTRAHLGRQTSEQLSDLSTGPNTFGPGRLATALGGNPEQRATLMAGTEAASPSAAQRLASALTAFETSRARLPPGSQTSTNLETAAETSGTRAAIAGGMGGSTRLFTDRLFNLFRDLRIGMSQDRMVKMVMANPQEAEALLAAAERARGNTAETRALKQAALSYIAANSGKEGQ